MIIAQSGRALAQSARKAGLRCVVLDCFGDEDTRECADAVEIVGGAAQGFDADRLIAAVAKYSPAGQAGRIVAGSGFEDRPDLLAAVVQGRQLIGIAPDTIRRVKDPAQFFHTLEYLQIPHPERRWDGAPTDGGRLVKRIGGTHIRRWRPGESLALVGCADEGGASLAWHDTNDGLRGLSPSYGTEVLLEGQPLGKGWLMKRIGGCGGTHIRRWRPGESLPPGFFLQREVQGTPMSAVVLSDGREARVIGYNELWLNPTAGQPFRWGGAVAVRPDPAVQSAVASAAQDLLQLFDLIGLFGIDWVLDSQGEIAILEVNPRPPATFPLHEGKSSLLAAHLAACAGEMPDWQADTTSHRALTIVYTEAGFNIPSDWQWPDWTADRPTLGMEIRSGEPVCTVLVEADTAQNARDLVAQRVRELMDELLAR